MMTHKGLKKLQLDDLDRVTGGAEGNAVGCSTVEEIEKNSEFSLKLKNDIKKEKTAGRELAFTISLITNHLHNDKYGCTCTDAALEAFIRKYWNLV